jgi:hypothetical protein
VQNVVRILGSIECFGSGGLVALDTNWEFGAEVIYTLAIPGKLRVQHSILLLYMMSQRSRRRVK